MIQRQIANAFNLIFLILALTPFLVVGGCAAMIWIVSPER